MASLNTLMSMELPKANQLGNRGSSRASMRCAEREAEERTQCGCDEGHRQLFYVNVVEKEPFVREKFCMTGWWLWRIRFYRRICSSSPEEGRAMKACC